MWKVGWLSLVLAAAFLACTPQKAFSPEQAVYLKLSQREKIVTRSIQVMPAVQLRDSYFVFVSYNMFSQNEQKQDLGDKCTALYEVARTNSGWEVSGHGTGCSSNPYTDVFGTHTGTNLDYAHGDGTFSFAGGETAIADASWVEVVWEDNTSQRVPVVDELFVALQDGSHRPRIYVVLDENGEETYRQEVPEDIDAIEITP